MSDARLESLRALADSAPAAPAAPAAAAPSRPKGPQRLTGIDLTDGTAIVGNGETYIGAALTAKEVKAISKIGHRAYRRAMLAHLDSVEAAVPSKGKRGRPAKSGKKRGRPAGSKNKPSATANGEAPRRRGRPPKVKTANQIAPPTMPVPPSTAEEATA